MKMKYEDLKITKNKIKLGLVVFGIVVVGLSLGLGLGLGLKKENNNNNNALLIANKKIKSLEKDLELAEDSRDENLKIAHMAVQKKNDIVSVGLKSSFDKWNLFKKPYLA